MRLPYFFFLSFIALAMSGCSLFTQDQAAENPGKPSIKYNENGDTVLINYNDKGLLLSEVTVKNNKMNGLAYNYYENGKIQNEISYVDGIKNGRATWNYENGKLYRETSYKDGEIDGIQKKYYEDGKLMAEVPYKNGVLQPGTREYSTSGTLKKNLPEIKIEAIDKIAFESQYILRVSLSKKQSNVKLYRITESMRGNSVRVPLILKDGYAEIKWILPKGTFIMEKVIIVAEYTTNLSNPVIIEKSYNVAVENR